MNAQAIPEMLDFARRVGYQPSDFARFNPIHIAGTKGKGSTSAFISSILGQYSKSPDPKAPKKIGLYTSPHLCSVRERIQINNAPISEALFAKYFFDIWDRLSSTGDGSKPVYFRYLTLMAYHLFLCEGVDSAVIECGIGGEYDTTNILPPPMVAAVTALGIDHVGMLGGTISEIAWHKAGIFKPGTSAFTVPQPESAMEVLKKRASEAQCDLMAVPTRPGIADGKIKLGLAGEFQKSNASLAVVTAAKHLTKLGVVGIPDPTENLGLMTREFHLGLERVRWPGRCDLRHEGKISWCLDGAHTLESIEVAGQWFASLQKPEQKRQRIMIFNQQSRDARALARALHTTLAQTLNDPSPFSNCIFTTNVTFKEAGYKPDLVSLNVDSKDVEALNVQRELAEVWAELDPKATTQVAETIEEAFQFAREAAAEDNHESLVLITGSLHLVGGAIEVLETQAAS
jgi:folylpolyglutamate synthase